MSDVLRKFVSDVNRATTAKRIISIGKAMAEHFDEERATLTSRAEAAEAQVAALRVALEPFADALIAQPDYYTRTQRLGAAINGVTLDDFERAASALKGEG